MCLWSADGSETLSLIVSQNQKRHKTVPKDDMMGPYNTLYVNVLDSSMPCDFHPRMHMVVVQSTKNRCFVRNK